MPNYPARHGSAIALAVRSPLLVSNGGSKSTESRQMYPPWPGQAFGPPPTKAEVWRAEELGRFAALLSWARAIRWRTRARDLWKAMVARPLYPVLALSIVAVCILMYIVWPGSKNFGRTAGSAELELQVERREANLRVNWNQNAPMVQRARGAVLTIRDGDSPSCRTTARVRTTPQRHHRV